MKENVKFYRCPICGNIVGLIDGDMSRVVCCGRPMEEMVANTTDAAVEKHVPVYEVEENEIVVKVGDVIHPMEEKHYITFITLVTEDRVIRKDLKPGDEPVVRFPYIPGSTIYEYCNLHGLWKNDVK